MKNKTVVFFGAGFTAHLGIPTSEEQNKLLSCYFFDSNEKFEKTYHDKIGQETVKIICSLKSQSDNKSEISFVKLYQYIRLFFKKDSFTVQAMYNLIDMHIESGRTIKSNITLNTVDIIRIRSEMVILLQIVFSAYTEVALADKSKIQKYVEFFKEIAKKLITEKEKMAIEGVDISSEEFILTPVSYISTNWDAIFLWSMFIAHKELNDKNNGYFCDNNKNLKIKIFNDFATFMAAEPIDKNVKATRWYPYNESVASRINDKDYVHEKCVSLIKTYLPHGQTNWLECPVCGKLSMYLGDEWKLNSETLPMKSIALNSNNHYKCVHCGYQLTTADSSMLLQTLYKHKSSYIQEIQTDMKLRLMKADRIVFIGYSLPDDDVDYRSLFTSLTSGKNAKKVYVILYDSNYSQKWIKYDEIVTKGSSATTAKRFTDIFGKENVCFNFKGFPEASNDIIDKIFSSDN